MTEAVKQYSGIDFDQVENTEEAKNWQKNITLHLKIDTKKEIY